MSEPALGAEGAFCGVHPGALAAFVCARCGTFGCGACAFSTLPKREVCASCAQKGLGEPIPWERRKELGLWRGYWRTVRGVLRTPTAFFRTPPTEPGVFSAVVHGVASTTLGLLLSYVTIGLLVMLGGGAAALFVPGDESETIGLLLGAYGCFMVGMSPMALAFGPPNALLGLVVAGAGTHGFLALFKKTRAPFEETLRALSYANAPLAWSWIPVLGAITYPWMVGLEAIALRETHRCGTDWAVAAAVGFRLALLVLLLGVYAALFGAIFLLERGGA